MRPSKPAVAEPAPEPAEPASLRQCRDYLLILYGQTVSAFGSRAASIAIPLLVLATGHSAAAAGAALFVGRLPALLYLPAGVLADRWDRRRTMLWCDALRLVAFATLSVSILLDRTTLAHLLAVSFLNGALAVLFEMSEKAALPSYVPAKLLPNAVSRNQARTLGADIAGPPMGGAMFGAGPALPFIANTVSYVVSAAALLFVRSEPAGPAERPALREAWRRELAEGLRGLWQDAFLRAGALLAAIVNLAFSGLLLTLIVTTEDGTGSATATGIVMGCFGAGGIAGAIATPAVLGKAPRSLVFIGSIWLWAALIPALLAAPSSVPLMGAVAALIAMLAPMWNTAAQLYQYERIPKELLGRVTSAGMMLATAAAPLGALAAGALLGSFGNGPTVLACAGVMLAAAVAATASRGFRQSAGDPASPQREQV